MADEKNEAAPTGGITTSAPKKLPAGWATDNETGLGYVEATGLTPVRLKVSEGGLGLCAGEIRGVSPKTAAAMCDKRSAELVFPA